MRSRRKNTTAFILASCFVDRVLQQHRVLKHHMLLLLTLLLVLLLLPLLFLLLLLPLLRTLQQHEEVVVHGRDMSHLDEPLVDRSC